MLNDMDIYDTISDNWLVVTSFISGLIAGNPRTIRKILGVFTLMFGLYRLYIFMRELKNPKFRLFLLRMFVTVFLTVTILFFVLITNGCTVVPDHKDVMENDFPMLGVDTISNDNEQGVIPITSGHTSVKPNVAIHDYLDSFSKLAKQIKVKRNDINTKHKRVIVEQDNAFKSERAAARKSRLVSCNIEVSTLRADNKIIAATSIQYGKVLLKAVEQLGITKKQVLKLPLNTCERYGLSFFFRLKHKGKNLRAKWLSCAKFPTLGLIATDKRGILVKLANTLRIKSINYKDDYIDYYKCRSLSKRKYFDKLKMGLFPSRKLNE